jgi:phage baseplate assembly protein W
MAGLTDPRAFLGTGWSFPVILGPNGDVAVVSHEEDIRQAILLILETEPSERAMRPEFGAGLRALAFEPLSTTTMALARHRVETALATWEPRIDHIEVSATASPSRGRLDLEIRYRVRSTNTFYNLVYPFYLQEGRS